MGRRDRTFVAAAFVVVIGTGEVLGRVPRLARPMLVGAALWGVPLLVIDVWALTRVAAA